MFLVTPLHRPGSANAATSVCLYKKQDRPLRCDVSRSSSHVWCGACGPPYPGASRPSRLPVEFLVCVSTRVPQRWRPSRCPPFCMPIHPQRWPIVHGRPMEVVAIPQPAVWRLIGHCASPVSLLCSPLPPPLCDILGTPPPAVSIDQWIPALAGNSVKNWPVN